jgi:hypothetical protein
VCFLCFVHSERQPKNVEMQQWSQTSIRNIENWKKADKWEHQRSEIKSGAAIAEVRDLIRGVESPQRKTANALAEKVGEAKERHVSLCRKMFTTADAFFTFSNILIADKQMGRASSSGVIAGMEAFMTLTGKSSPLAAATALAQTAIALEREALGIDRMENAGELRKWLQSLGYDFVRVLEDGGIERLADEP